jgi:hypothetical protein
MKFAELDVVRLKEDIPEMNLISGMIGTILLIFEKPEEGYEVEFANEKGETIAELALRQKDLDFVCHKDGSK